MYIPALVAVQDFFTICIYTEQFVCHIVHLIEDEKLLSGEHGEASTEMGLRRCSVVHKVSHLDNLSLCSVDLSP
jgi:hypothetical protein